MWKHILILFETLFENFCAGLSFQKSAKKQGPRAGSRTQFFSSVGTGIFKSNRYIYRSGLSFPVFSLMNIPENSTLTGVVFLVFLTLPFPGNTTSIHSTAEKGDDTAFIEQLKQGAAPNQRDKQRNTPLILASRVGHFSKVKILLSTEEGRNGINFKNKSGETALISAAKNGHEEVVKLLLENGPKVNLTDSKHNNTALMAAIQSSFPNKDRIVKSLLQRKANPNLRNKTGNTPLMEALSSTVKRKEIIILLLQYGANPRLRNQEGLTAKDLALQMEGGEEIAALFENQGRSEGFLTEVVEACFELWSD